jgi:molecular chaperone GrpE
VSPGERDGPSEGAVREQLREEPGPRASSAPAPGEHAGDDEATGGRSGAGSKDERGPGGGFVGAPAGAESDEAAGESAAVTASEAGLTDEGAAPPAAAEDADAGEPADPLAEAERRRDEYLELAQRTQADFENFRRRAARESAAAGARAKAGLVREILPALDNLERALAAMGEADEGLAGGVRMVHEELVGALERSGVAAFEPSGEPFDPTVHEALSTRAADGAEPGVVLDVVEKGYRLDDTVLRPARVVVSA